MKKLTLTEQFLFICVSIIVIVIISLGMVLPKTLLPVYEENLYNYLNQSLNLLEKPENNRVDSEVAYIYIDSDKNILVSSNLSDVVNIKDVKVIINKVNNDEGKFMVGKKVYYYYTNESNGMRKIAITTNSYINSMKKEILKIILIVVGITFIIISLLVLIWSNSLVNRIKKLKDKVDNINNDDYDHKMIYDYDDVKTPITVMKSYIEAMEDGIESEEKTTKIVKEQLNKLEVKVHSLLYLNKLNYLKEEKEKLNDSCDVSKIILASVDKFSPSRSDVVFSLDIDKKNTVFRGSDEMWEAIIDNILNNFMRYAKSQIKITLKNNKIILYNDGPNIDKDVLNNIFTPYEKGVRGVFGLGLSIVKKTLGLLNYDINIENVKNGVKFIIS